MSKINVVIIDSGINMLHPSFCDDEIVIKNIDVDINNSGTDTYGHGTAIYGIVRKCPEANIYNIKIDDIENGIDTEVLVAALRYVLYNIPNANIINLSLGVTILDNDELYKVCAELSAKGIIIVSAFDNSCSISYPAAFDNVIGVTSGKLCRKTTDFEYYDDDIVNIAAKGSLQRVCWLNPNYIMIAGNSFACAHVTTQIVRFMAQGIKDKNEILQEFKKYQ